MNRKLPLNTLFSGAFLFAIILFSTGLKAEQSDRDLPKRGTLSTTFQAGDEGITVPGQWGAQETDIFSEETTPIAGSVSRGAGNDWIARVFNNSGDRFTVDLEVIQYDNRRRQVRSDSFAASLQPNQSIERTFTARANSHQAELNLRSWRNLSAEQREREAALEAARAEAEAEAEE